MRSLLPLLLVALALLLPAASAQAPDPGAVVSTACGLLPVADKVPLCPAPDPAAPADPHQHSPAPQPPAAPQNAQQVAQSAVEQAQGAIQEPQSAPERVAALAATLVQFVKDVVQPPLDAINAFASATLAKAAAAKAAAGAAFDDISARIGALFAQAGVHQPDAKRPTVRAPKTGTAADSVVDKLVTTVGAQVPT